MMCYDKNLEFVKEASFYSQEKHRVHHFLRTAKIKNSIYLFTYTKTDTLLNVFAQKLNPETFQPGESSTVFTHRFPAEEIVLRPSFKFAQDNTPVFYVERDKATHFWFLDSNAKVLTSPTVSFPKESGFYEKVQIVLKSPYEIAILGDQTFEQKACKLAIKGNESFHKYILTQYQNGKVFNYELYDHKKFILYGRLLWTGDSLNVSTTYVNLTTDPYPKTSLGGQVNSDDMQSYRLAGLINMVIDTKSHKILDTRPFDLWETDNFTIDKNNPRFQKEFDKVKAKNKVPMFTKLAPKKYIATSTANYLIMEGTSTSKYLMVWKINKNNRVDWVKFIHENQLNLVHQDPLSFWCDYDGKDLVFLMGAPDSFKKSGDKETFDGYFKLPSFELCKKLHEDGTVDTYILDEREAKKSFIYHKKSLKLSDGNVLFFGVGNPDKFGLYLLKRKNN